MFLLKLDENKPEEALVWYEKALKVAVNENGNTATRNEFIQTVIK
jgi:hypothetical protein